MRIGKLISSSLLAVFVVLALVCAMAGAAEAEGPWWHLSSGMRPSYLQPGGEGTMVVQAIRRQRPCRGQKYKLSDSLAEA